MTKEVTFCETIIIHPMIHWSYAYKNARKGKWEEYARDRDRFKRRIQTTDLILSPILKKKLSAMSSLILKKSSQDDNLFTNK
jgi:hypothetical protein